MSLQFASPLALVLLLAVPALLVWELRGGRRQPALRLSSLEGAQALPTTWRVRLRWVPVVLRAAALALLVVALARPQSGRAEALLPQEGIDIVLVLDTSSSMRTPEGDENSRLGTARGVLREFVAERERDRLGLVTFRSGSFVLSPLTLDYSAFQALVDQADDVDLPDGTAIGLAMTDALNLLRDSTARSRTIILLSDGENNREDVQPLAAARIAEALGIRFYAIDVTGAAAPVGMHTRFRPHETELRTMAELTGGRYFSATSPHALAEVYETIDMLERSRVGGERFADFDEFASYFLGGALGLLAAQVLLTTLVLRRIP